MVSVLRLGLLFSSVILIVLKEAEAAFISVEKDPQAAMSAETGLLSPITEVSLDHKRSDDQIPLRRETLGVVEQFSQCSLVSEIGATKDSLKREANFSPVGIMVAQAVVGLVPEPSSIILAAFGLVGLIALGWRRKQQSFTRIG